MNGKQTVLISPTCSRSSLQHNMRPTSRLNTIFILIIHVSVGGQKARGKADPNPLPVPELELKGNHSNVLQAQVS